MNGKSMDMKVEFLKDIKIVCFAINLPAPLACRRLFEMGAHVTKVEPPEGDSLQLHFPDWYKRLTEGWDCYQLDLRKNSADKKKLNLLLLDTDLFVSGFRTKALENLGFDWQAVHRHNKRIIYLSILGNAPPHQDHPGHDLTYQAENGLIDDGSTKLPRVLAADYLGAERAASQALAQIFHRSLRGEATYSETYLSEAARWLRDPIEYGATADGELLGGGLPEYNLYSTQDGQIAIAAIEGRFKERIQKELGLTDWTYDTLSKVFKLRSAKQWDLWAKQLNLPVVAVAGQKK